MGSLNQGSHQEVADHHPHEGECEKKRIAHSACALQHQNANNREHNDNIDLASSRNEAQQLVAAKWQRTLKKSEDGSIPRQVLLVPDGFGQPVEPAERNQDSKENNK
ncbi:MAG TPA: hypothetical protein VFD66_07430 [Verrucomicrobiae bacterium]|nr:hypothetical protein [Verrucomicrobiae bacterium]